MTCRSVMQRDVFTVAETASLREAIDQLFRHRVKTLPAVDAQNRYVGLFSIATLVTGLLPRAALLDEGAELTGLGFVHDSLETLKGRFVEREQEPVSAFLDRELRPLTIDDSLPETLLRLHHDRRPLPVVDASSRQILGIVTYWSVLAALTGRSA